MCDWFTVWKDNQSQNAKNDVVKAPKRNGLQGDSGLEPRKRCGENSLGKGMIDYKLQTFSGLPKW